MRYRAASNVHMPLDHPEFAAAARQMRFLGVDFDGVMTDNRVFVFEDGREAVRCSRLEGFGLRRLEQTGVEIMIISTEKNAVVTRRANKLNLACRQDVDDKVALMASLLSDRSIDWSQAGFLGNDLNDRGLLERVGLPVVVGDAHESLDDVRAFRTSRIGGDGAVRETCDAAAAAREVSRDREG